MTWQPLPKLRLFGQNDCHSYYAAVLTCVVMKKDKCAEQLSTGSTQTQGRFLCCVGIEVQKRQADLRILMINQVTKTDCDQTMQGVEACIFLHASYKIRESTTKICSALRISDLCQNPVDMMPSRRHTDIFLILCFLCGAKRTVRVRSDKCIQLLATFLRSLLMRSERRTSAGPCIDDCTTAWYMKLKSLKNVIDDSIKGLYGTTKHRHQRNIDHQKEAKTNQSTEGRSH
ncbi:hypothetical protein HPB50_025741 [Hyalomma asiaticum]|uniref:Uncharacterized protein n=1 Tax=Hyalomma asiaticum TaxID=266040 RepID=A0ACB7TNP4_HYAAI|nr:hypothetical protein HPB50_025741 [Hyalomma asiaticum]